MWPYTCYMLYAFIKYLERVGEVRKENGKYVVDFPSFSSFVFGRVWREGGLVFHDSVRDLEDDVKFVARLGVVTYDEHTKRIVLGDEELEVLRKVADTLKENPLRGRIPIIDEYLKRIEEAMVP